MFGLVTAPQGSTPQYTADQMKPIEELYAQVPEAERLHRDRRASRRSSTATPCCASSRGRSARASSSRSPRSCGPKFAADSRRASRSRSTRRRSARASARRRSSTSIMSQVPYAELQRHRRPLPRRSAQVSRACRTCRSTCASTRPRCASTINRDKLSDVGVDVDTVGRTLETMLGGRQVTRFKREGEQYDVIVQVAPLDRTTPADISDSYVRARDGSMVQLSNLVDVTRRRGAAVAQPLQPAARGEDHRHAGARATPSTRRSKAMDDAAKRVLPPHRADRPRRPVARVPRVGQGDLLHLRARADVHLPRAVGAVRELRASVRDHAVGAAVDDRRAARAVAHGRHAQHLQPGRPGHAGRPHHQARHPDRRVRQPAARARARRWSTPWSTPRRCGCGRS